jgi:hypothetical protein
MFGMDFSKYYDYHDKNYYGNEVRLSDMGRVLDVERNAFLAGLGSNPLQWPFQAVYSAATTAVGTSTALDNSLKDLVGKADFSSLNDFFGGVFGESGINPNDLGVDNIVAGGCTEPQVPTLPGQSAPGSGSGAPGQGAPPAKGKAGAPDGNASGAGKDGVLITTAQGNPSAAAAAIEASFRKDNQAALNKAQAEERAKQEQNDGPENIDTAPGTSKKVTPERIQSIEEKVNSRFGKHMQESQRNDAPASRVSTVHPDPGAVQAACGNDPHAAACHIPQNGKPGPINFPPQTSDHVIAHEVIHRNSSQLFRKALGKDFNEGVTDYFTKQISGAYGSADYHQEQELAKDIAQSIGEDTLRRAYFGGDPDAIAKVKESRGRRF